MEIIYEIAGNTLTARLFGEMDHYTAGKVREDIDSTMKQYETINLVFDFSRVTFMDSSGIGVVLGRYKILQPSGGKVLIAGCSQKLYSILNMAGVFSLIPCTQTREEAIRLLQEQEAEKWKRK